MRPLVGIVACVKAIEGDDLAYHAVPDPYIDAVHRGAGCEPVLLPAIGAPDPGLLARLDGLVLTGSRSNVLPHHYGGRDSDPGTLHDPRRDATTLALIPAALAGGLPLIAICRGFQELNVALGGTLHQKIHEVPDYDDHRSPGGPADAAFAPRHGVALAPGGVLARLAGSDRAEVNSLHGQGIDRLAPGLAVEARAPDGVIEAVRVDAADIFALGLQWHPEWRFAEDPLSAALWREFGAAARRRLHGRRASDA